MDRNNSQPSAWKASQPATPATHSPTLARVAGVLRGLTGVAGAMTIGMMVAEHTLPPKYRPSTWIGEFHGRIEAADADVKVVPVTTLTRKSAEATAEPPAIAAMEAEVSRQQQQVLVESMQTQSTIANAADGACVVGKVIPRDNRDWGWLGTLLSQTCGVGDQVRQDMMNTLRRGGQDNSVLIQRPRADNQRGR